MEQSKRRALGRGLEELFNSNEPLDYTRIEERILETSSKEEVVNIKIEDLRSNPYQPRKVFNQEALEELAESIKEHGLIQPIIVKKSIKGYEIIAGERRTKASVIAGFDTIPAIIRDFNDQEMMEIALLENLQREDLNAIEEAQAYKKIQSSLVLTQEELSKRLGKSRSHITNMLGLLNLPEEVKDLLVTSKISMSHARVLSKIEDKDKVIELANKIVDENLNVRQIEAMTTNSDSLKKRNQINVVKKSSEFTYLEENMCDKLGTRVKIKPNKIEISFTNVNDLNRILEILEIEG